MRFRYASLLAGIAALSISGCMPTNPIDRLKAAAAAESQGNYPQAIDILTQLLNTAARTDDVKAALYNMRCIAYQRSGDTEKSVADCSEALRLKPDLAAAYNNRAMAYLVAGQIDLAIADWDVGTRLKPDDAVAFDNRGFAYMRKGDYPHALADFNEAIRIKPDFSTAHSSRGSVYLHQGDSKKAFDEATQAIKLDAKNAGAYELRSLLYVERSDFAAAQNDLSTAINLQPKSAVFYGDRGILEVVVGNYYGAAADLSQSQRLEPKNSDAIIWLHIARVKSGTDDGAEIERNVAQIDQTRWPAPIIAVYRRQLDPQKLLETAAQNNTDPAKPLRCAIYFHVAEFETFNRDLGQADELFRKAIADCPSYSPERVIAQNELKARTR